MRLKCWTGAALAAGIGLACAGQSAFLCSTDSQCDVEGRSGLCQPTGFCSFAATDCPSGQRFGDNSGPTSGQCVEPAGTGSDGGASPQETASPSDDADSTETGAVGTSVASDTSDSGGGETAASESSGGPALDPDLVLWLRLDEAMGPLYFDSSLYANDGSCFRETCPMLVEGQLLGAAKFDGINDHIAVPDAPAFETPQGFTLGVWVNLDEVPSSQASLLTKPVGNEAFNTWELYFGSYQAGVPVLQLSMGDGDGADVTAVTQGPFPLNTWFHVAGRWDGVDLELLVDGLVVATVANKAYAIDDHPVYVGADDDNVDGIEAFFPGAIDDVRVYRRVLDDAELQALINGR